MYCQCGCGELAPVPTRTSRTLGRFKGVPLRYIHGHVHHKPVKYRVDPDTGCWNWLLGRNRNGYGNWTVQGRARQAHRVMYERIKGPIPPGMDLHHLCDNRGCVNPAHLVPATDAENTRLGRSAKLTAEQVAEIRRRPRGYGTGRKLAAEFGVTEGTISNIRLRKNWTTV